MRLSLFSLAAAALIAVTNLSAQTVTCKEVCDINDAKTPISSNPDGERTTLQGNHYNKGLIKCGKFWFFSATTCKEGNELWRTDGTVAGTVIVRDIVPGAGGSNPDSFTCCRDPNGREWLYFSATTPTTGYELWRSDGSAVGTTMVKDIRAGTASGVSSFDFYGECKRGRLYFAANDGTSGVELWCSDGTSAGTVLVRDIYPGASSSSPLYLKLNSAGTEIYFSAFVGGTGGTGREIWKTCGTLATTVLVKDIRAGTSSSSPTYFTNFAGKTIFRAGDATSGTELWETGGTGATTLLLKDIRAGTSSSFPDLYYFGVLGNKLYFEANDGSGNELYETDGTTAGTVRTADIRTGTLSSSPSQHCVIGNTLYFRATTNTQGTELLKYTGTGSPTVVKDIRAGSLSSFPWRFQNCGGKLFFYANTGTTGNEPFASDGSLAGTGLLKDIQPGTSSSSPGWPTPINATKCIFTAFDTLSASPTGREWWETDMTPAGTKLFKDLEPGSATPSSSPRYLECCWGNTVVFSASDGKTGSEPWAYNTSSGACTLIKDIRPGTSSSSPFDFECCGDKVYFRANDGTTGTELYEWDGTTVKSWDIRTGSSSSFPSNLTCCNNKLFFTANNGTSGTELWVIDPSAPDATRKPVLIDIRPGASSSSPFYLTCCKDKLYFRANNGTNGNELWCSDGTAAGTKMVADIYPGPSSSSPTYIICCPDAQGNPRLFFRAFNPTSGTELWKWDPTGGAALVKDIRAGTLSSFPFIDRTNNPCCDGKVFFYANDGTTGNEPYVSDGTAAGTFRLADLYTGTSSSSPRNFICCGKVVYFTAFVGGTGGTGTELYKTDGTAAGTMLVKDIRAGSSSSSPFYLKCVGDRLYFRANDGLNGTELWASNGTAAGTTMVCDIRPGSSSSSPSYIICCCGDLYFSASSAKHGTELWTAIKPGAMVEVVGQGCDGIELMASAPPRLGGSFHLEGWCAPVGSFNPPRGHLGITYFMIKPFRRRPQHLPFLLDKCCWIWLPFVAPDVVHLTKHWRSAPFNIPNLKFLCGIPLFYQSFYYNLSSIFPVKTSNGLLLTIGN